MNGLNPNRAGELARILDATSLEAILRALESLSLERGLNPMYPHQGWLQAATHCGHCADAVSTIQGKIL